MAGLSGSGTWAGERKLKAPGGAGVGGGRVEIEANGAGGVGGESTVIPSPVSKSTSRAVAGGGGDERREVRARFKRGDARLASTSSSSRSLALPFFCALGWAEGRVRD